MWVLLVHDTHQACSLFLPWYVVASDGQLFQWLLWCTLLDQGWSVGGMACKSGPWHNPKERSQWVWGLGNVEANEEVLHHHHQHVQSICSKVWCCTPIWLHYENGEGVHCLVERSCWACPVPGEAGAIVVTSLDCFLYKKNGLYTFCMLKAQNTFTLGKSWICSTKVLGFSDPQILTLCSFT